MQSIRYNNFEKQENQIKKKPKLDLKKNQTIDYQSKF